MGDRGVWFNVSLPVPFCPGGNFSCASLSTCLRGGGKASRWGVPGVCLPEAAVASGSCLPLAALE